MIVGSSQEPSLQNDLMPSLAIVLKECYPDSKTEHLQWVSHPLLVDKIENLQNKLDSKNYSFFQRNFFRATPPPPPNDPWAVQRIGTVECVHWGHHCLKTKRAKGIIHWKPGSFIFRIYIAPTRKK